MTFQQKKMAQKSKLIFVELFLSLQNEPICWHQKSRVTLSLSLWTSHRTSHRHHIFLCDVDEGIYLVKSDIKM